MAALAGYAFAWLEFPGRDWLFVVVIGLLVVPIQVALIPIREEHAPYARELAAALQKERLRVDCMDGAGHMNKKIKSAEHAKVPFMLILGGKEMETRTVTVRERGKEEQATVPFEQFVERVRSLVEKRALTL